MRDNGSRPDGSLAPRPYEPPNSPRLQRWLDRVQMSRSHPYAPERIAPEVFQVLSEADAAMSVLERRIAELEAHA